jgi:hypothetical protein
VGLGCVQGLWRMVVGEGFYTRPLYRNPKVVGHLKERFAVACFHAVGRWLEAPLLVHPVPPLL